MDIEFARLTSQVSDKWRGHGFAMALEGHVSEWAGPYVSVPIHDYVMLHH